MTTSLDQLSKDVSTLTHEFSRHADQDADNFVAIRETLVSLQGTLAELHETIAPIAKAYNGFVFSKEFVIGLSSVVLAVGGIGAGIMWLVGWVRGH